MSTITHLGSVVVGSVATTEVLQQVNPESENALIALASSVIIQTLIYALAEFKKFLKKKSDERKAAQAVEP